MLRRPKPDDEPRCGPADETAPHRPAHQARIVPNGREAVETLTHQTYVAVLMDCRVPEMDGFEPTGTIRQQEPAGTMPRIAMIELTANAMQGDKEKFLIAGMDDYLTKPVKPALPKATLASRLVFWLPSSCHKFKSPLVRADSLD